MTRVLRVELYCSDGRVADTAGLQDKSGELTSGERDGEGVRYAAKLDVRAGREGDPDFSGPFVHGTPGQRFLYLSTPNPDGSGWLRRCKIMLPPSAPARGTRLRATLVDVSSTRARLDSAGWRPGP
ncbi:DUF5990 family protein [Nocardia sp. NPDC047038]|uniref:DUF5990 family protein n=1 Tax=Nocardia sp. NPDC047038 TaxID=3154338 RepID=UPI0033FC6FB4